MYVYPRDTAGVATVVWGVWERWNIETARKLIKKHMDLISHISNKKEKTIALDIGANLGIYALNLANNFEKLLAVEASPIVSKVLEANVLTNKLEDKIDINVLAFGDKDGEQIMNINLSSSGLSSFEEILGENIKKIPIKMYRGDTIISNNYSSFSLMFIKCDVEGYELDVLKGLNESIKKDFPLIQIEHDGKNSKSLEVINFLQSLGYKYLYARESKVPSPIQSILGSVGFWPKLIMINKVKPKFYQAIWLSTIDLKI
jgi:hypothetical protein